VKNATKGHFSKADEGEELFRNRAKIHKAGAVHKSLFPPLLRKENRPTFGHFFFALSHLAVRVRVRVRVRVSVSVLVLVRVRVRVRYKEKNRDKASDTATGDTNE
jgi:hypothetical protein